MNQAPRTRASSALRSRVVTLSLLFAAASALGVILLLALGYPAMAIGLGLCAIIAQLGAATLVFHRRAQQQQVLLRKVQEQVKEVVRVSSRAEWKSEQYYARSEKLLAAAGSAEQIAGLEMRVHALQRQRPQQAPSGSLREKHQPLQERDLERFLIALLSRPCQGCEPHA